MHCLLAHRRPLPRPSRRPDPRHLLLLLLLFSATSLGLLAYYVSRSSRRVSLFVAPTPNRGTQTTHLPFRPLQSCSEPWVKGIKHRRSTENLEPSQMKSNISGSLFAKHSWVSLYNMLLIFASADLSLYLSSCFICCKSCNVGSMIFYTCILYNSKVLKCIIVRLISPTRAYFRSIHKVFVY